MPLPLVELAGRLSALPDPVSRGELLIAQLGALPDLDAQLAWLTSLLRVEAQGDVDAGQVAEQLRWCIAAQRLPMGLYEALEQRIHADPDSTLTQLRREPELRVAAVPDGPTGPAAPTAEQLDLRLPVTVARLAALSEQTQRIQVLGELVQLAPAAEVVELLIAALASIGDGDPRARILIEVFHAAVDAGHISYEARTQLYQVAVERGAEQVRQLLLPPPPREQVGEAEQMPGSLAALGQPLGRRTWLARRADRDTIDRLVVDTDPTVIENLLLNPLLVERDVVRIVARRPNTAEVILAVGRSPKWARRYPVRRSLVFNPYTPVDLALRQVPFLNRADLFAVATDPQLHANVRDSAMSMARQRPPELPRSDGAEPVHDLGAEQFVRTLGSELSLGKPATDGEQPPTAGASASRQAEMPARADDAKGDDPPDED